MAFRELDLDNDFIGTTFHKVEESLDFLNENKASTNSIAQKLEAADVIGDYVIRGFLPPVPTTGLTVGTPSGSAFISGTRLSKPAESPRTYVAETDTYVYLRSDGSTNYLSVDNDFEEPDLEEGDLWLFKVVTNSDSIAQIEDKRGKAKYLSHYHIYEELIPPSPLRISNVPSYTLDILNSTILVNASSGDVEILLPLASRAKGRIYRIKKIDGSSNDVNIRTIEGDDIEGFSTISLTSQYQKITLQPDSIEWWIF